jgi:tagatose-1,6-bisphosphate aldolase
MKLNAIQIDMLRRARELIESGEVKFICHAIRRVHDDDEVQEYADLIKAIVEAIRNDAEAARGYAANVLCSIVPFYFDDCHDHACRLAWIDKMLLTGECV